MATALLTHSDCHEHVTPPGHPERVDRLRAVLAALEAPRFQDLIRIEAPAVDADAVARAHPPAYSKALYDGVPTEGWAQIDGDTFLAPGSMRAAERVAGAAVEAVDLVMRGEVGNVFCAVRPPGHHAETVRAMGFCLWNGVAIGALHALEAHGLSRVAIVDFDVHHGNGTQEIFERDGRVFYGSSHQFPLFPGTGAARETGVGNIVNVPLSAYSGTAAFQEAYEGRILPALDAFAPQLLIMSAGFDAHRDDPLAQLELTEDDFVWVTEKLCAVAGKHCGGKVVSMLEGGYDLDALARSAARHVDTLMAHSVR